MESSDDNKRQILESFLDNLAGIADKEYQKKIWIEGNGPEVDSFDDAVCDFFDLGEYIFENYKLYNITVQQQKLLEKFRNVFENFSNENDFPEEFIDTPEWTRITEMTKEVLEAFNYKKRR